MEKRYHVKSTDEYSAELEIVAPLEVVQQFRQLCTDGKKIQAIKILRIYGITTDFE